MSNSMSNLLNNERLWRYLGLGSYMICLSCFVFGAYWKDAFVEMDVSIIIIQSLCGMAIYIFYPILLAANDELRSVRMAVRMTASVFLIFLLYIITRIYDQYDEGGKTEMGYKRILREILSEALTLTLLSLFLQVTLDLKVPRMLGLHSNANSNIINRPIFWRFLGFGSGMVGFSCYAFSPTFKYIFGEWNWWKIVIYIAVAFVFSYILLFVKQLGSRKNFTLKANVCFFVFVVTCICSYYQDRSEEGKNESDIGKMLSMFSFGGFAFMSLSLSRLTNIGFDIGATSFFLTGFFMWAIKINLQVATVTAFICCVFFYIWSYSDS